MNKILDGLRASMKREGVDTFFLPNTDPHMGEYIGEYHKYVKFLSGFSGSNATVVVTQKEAGLWTDGRYFIQASKQLTGSGIKMYKENTEGEPTVLEFVKKNTPKNGTLAFDGRLVTKKQFEDFDSKLSGSGIRLKEDFYTLDDLWEGRPQMSKSPLWILEEKYSGKSMKKKLKEIRNVLKEKKADSILINDLCDIAWVCNLRADDIYTLPVFYAYLYIDKKNIKLFVQREALSRKIQKYLFEQTDDNIDILELDSAYQVLSGEKKKTVLVDPEVINIALIKTMDTCEFKEADNLVLRMRSVKNPVEMKNLMVSHVQDGVALTKYIYGIKKEYAKKDSRLTTETKVSEDLLKLRSKAKDFVEESFATIAAYKANAAMAHYTPGPDNNATVEKKGFLLIDSGGHYLSGTTDVTRTIGVGELSQEEKEHYTLVLKGHLNLMNARFRKGTCGESLDILARNPFWMAGKDYLHGTGHGVGYLLSVHEGLHTLRWKIFKKPTEFEVGMVITDEPGFYVEGEYGIRIENELLCVKDKTNEFGSFLKFKNLTFVPYEMDAVILEMLSDEEIGMLNDYNALIRKTLSPHLTKAENEWLKTVTAKVKR